MAWSSLKSVQFDVVIRCGRTNVGAQSRAAMVKCTSKRREKAKVEEQKSVCSKGEKKNMAKLS